MLAPVTDTDEIIIAYTNLSNALNFITIPTERDYFLFALTACENALVVLSTVPGVTDSQAWQVVIDHYAEGMHVSYIMNMDTGVSDDVIIFVNRKA